MNFFNEYVDLSRGLCPCEKKNSKEEKALELNVQKKQLKSKIGTLKLTSITYFNYFQQLDFLFFLPNFVHPTNLFGPPQSGSLMVGSPIFFNFFWFT